MAEIFDKALDELTDAGNRFIDMIIEEEFLTASQQQVQVVQ